MKIVGVGAAPGLLTPEAISAILGARIIYGSRRAIELAGEHIRCGAFELEDYTLSSLPRDAVVLSTGDPMLSGLGKFAGKGDEVIPGISSLQLACSRLHMGTEDIGVITAHSRDADAVKKLIIPELEAGKNVFLLPDDSFGVDELSSLLNLHGISGQIWTFEDLGYPEERVSNGTVSQPPAVKSKLYCVIISPNSCPPGVSQSS